VFLVTSVYSLKSGMWVVWVNLYWLLLVVISTLYTSPAWRMQYISLRFDDRADDASIKGFPE